MSKYIALFHMGVITYPCRNLDAGMTNICLWKKPPVQTKQEKQKLSITGKPLIQGGPIPPPQKKKINK